MDPVAIIIGISWTCGGFLCAALAVPLVRCQVRPNALYGVRFRQSFKSEEAWYAINRFGGRQMIVWSVPLIAVGIASFFLPLQRQTSLALFLGFAPLIFILIPMVITWRYARRRNDAT